MSRKMMIAISIGVLAAAGCTTSGGWEDDTTVDNRLKALERENKARQDAIVKLQGEVAALRAEREELRQLLEAAKVLNTTGGVPAGKPFRFEVEKVGIGFLSCAIDTDGVKGDDAIAAYINLTDQYDTSMKAAGTFRFDVFDLARAKDQIIRSWTFKPEVAAGYWQRFPGCYQFKLPLGGEVRAKKVILKVTFGRTGKEPLTAIRERTVEQP